MADAILDIRDSAFVKAYPIRLVDNGDGTYSIAVTAILTSDVEIGAVEIKNSTDDTRATVGANGLYADVRVIQSGTNNIGDVDEAPIACASADVHAPAANTAAIVTYTASAGLKHVITGISWSYVGGIPSGGNLKVEDVSGTTIFTTDIDESGPGIIIFPKPKKSATANTAMIVTLAAGGNGVTGKVSILNHWTEA